MTEIVTDLRSASDFERPPLLVLDVVQQFLDEHGLGDGPMRAARIGTGSSNVTFMLERPQGRYVLRRPPRPPFAESAHDVLREARLQLALHELDLRVPKIVAVCEDVGLLGVPFYVMDYIHGDVVTAALPSLLQADVRERRRAVEDLVAVLVEIHAADVSSALLAPFARRGDYLERQVRRFASLWEANATRDIPAVHELATWLQQNLPRAGDTTVVHGDFRLGNVMLTRTAPVRVAAVLDWELGAVGDPRADLGYLVATYSHTFGHGTPLELSPVTALDGFPRPEEIVESYETLSGRDVGPLAWFEVLALWKGAVFCEAIYNRFLHGEMNHDPFAAGLERGVPTLVAAASRIVETA